MRRIFVRKAACRGLAVVGMLIAFAGIFFGNALKVRAEEEIDSGRILFISSYSLAWDSVRLEIEGLRESITDKFVLDYEFMDTKRVCDEEAENLFYKGIKYRLSKVEPYDVIILGDDAALKFALKHRSELFADLPLIFIGVNDRDFAVKAASDPTITGITEMFSSDTNIELALSIYPNAKKVVGIFDDSVTGAAERENFYANEDKFPNLEFGDINPSELTSVNLRAAITGVDKDTILFYAVMSQDASGKQYTNKEAIDFVADNSRVPVFMMLEGGMSYGRVLGGNLFSLRLSGNIAARTAIQLIKKEVRIQDIELIDEVSSIYCMDEQVMKQFGVKKSLLPEETVYVNHKASFIERNSEALIVFIVCVAALVVIIAYVCVDNIKRRKLLEELEEAKNKLQTASEHDFLTGLSNRSRFMKDLEERLAEKKPCMVIMLDIDNFKGINDTYGHAAGDEALIELAARLKGMQTELLTPYRLAGDEFIMILKSNYDRIINNTVLQCPDLFKKPFTFGGEKHNIHGSMGVALYPNDAKDVEELIERADAAMYEVKNGDKNGLAFYRDLKK